MTLVIIGGGITGITLALAVSSLTNNALKIILIEHNDLSDIFSSSSYYEHTIALAAGTCQKLIDIDVWKYIEKYTTAIKYIHVSERNNFGMFSIQAKNYNIDALGYVVSLLDLKKTLFNSVKKLPNVHIYCPSTVNQILRHKNNITVLLSSGECITSSLLVMANGSLSTLASTCGMQWTTTNFKQIALVANVTTELSNKFNAFEQFSNMGPLSLLPISDKKLALVWCHNASAYNVVNSWTNKEFLFYLQKDFGWRLGKFIFMNERLIYPIQSSIAISPISHRLVLVGNAAQTLHPIAGQGFNLCFRDVISLAETLMFANSKNKDIGSYEILNSYYIRRKIDRKIMFNFTNNLAKLFINTNPLFILSRNIGLTLLNYCPFIRKKLIEYSLGWVNY